MAVGFHRLCCLWEAQRGDRDVYKIWNVHTGLIYGLHRSATKLKPLGENNIDHLVTMQCSVGKPGVLACGSFDIVFRLSRFQYDQASVTTHRTQWICCQSPDARLYSWVLWLILGYIIVGTIWAYKTKKQQYPLSIMFMDHSCNATYSLIRQTQKHLKLIAYEWIWLNVMGN